MIAAIVVAMLLSIFSLFLFIVFGSNFRFDESSSINSQLNPLKKETSFEVSDLGEPMSIIVKLISTLGNFSLKSKADLCKDFADLNVYSFFCFSNILFLFCETN